MSRQVGKLTGGDQLFLLVDISLFDVLQSPGGAEADALRVAIAKVAVDDFVGNRVPDVGAERTDGNTRLAAQTARTVDHGAAQLLIPLTATGGTDGDAGSIHTLVADDGDDNALTLPFGNADAAAGRINGAGMLHRTDHLTETAAGALFVVNDQDFSHEQYS